MTLRGLVEVEMIWHQRLLERLRSVRGGAIVLRECVTDEEYRAAAQDGRAFRDETGCYVVMPCARVLATSLPRTAEG